MAGDKESVTALAISITVIGIVVLLILKVRLNTKIDPTGIHYSFSPLQRRIKTIKWEEMIQCKVKKYNPVRDYGGYGWRYSIAGKGRALNIRGKMGIQIILKNNKKLLIGTQKPEEAQKTISNYIHKISKL